MDLSSISNDSNIPSSGEACVAIVGLGFSGVATALHLLRGLPPGATLHLLERGDSAGRGVAYGTRCDSHLLNVPAGRLGWDPADEASFLAWLTERGTTDPQGQPLAAADFAPRRLLGSYLEHGLTQAIDAARARGVRVRSGLPGVTGLVRQGPCWRLQLSDGSTLSASQVVLATGHLPPARPPVTDAASGDSAWQAPGWFADPWAQPAWCELPAEADVLLLGSGLTAIDMVTQLRDQGHRGRITMLSRRGLLPQPHRVLEARPRPGLSPISELGPDLKLRLVLRAVRRWVAEAEADGRDWRDVMASLRSCTPKLWQRLTVRDRRQFLRHVQPWWDTHRHRLAPVLWQALQDDMAAGRVASVAGRLRHAEQLADGRWALQWQPRGSAEIQGAEVHAIINCTGPTSSLRHATDPLLASLRERGMLSADALGLGLLTDTQHRPLDSSGVAVEDLFYIGPMLKAQHWEATAIPELRQHAAQTAQAVLAEYAVRCQVERAAA
ncbi:FAD/NAD(P)-binding protein [Ideonella azotifigens]|uniref:FAD/NAD(P)-binding protein n=1 Tax=Ideonella azotifigens TaxID=513160 RepID=A0ABP3V0H7_9BURK|nr:FAD/NAD(P)-binding protein [Ideonella azotifigens]MCD2339908.1 FAD/NAD(P)-binding protein [Ideonella azotifigens]